MKDRWKYIFGCMALVVPIWLVCAIFIKPNPPKYNYEIGETMNLSEDTQIFLDEDPKIKKIVLLHNQRLGIVQWQQHYGINESKIIVKRYQIGKNKISGLIYSD